MRSAALLAAITLATASCGGTASSGGHSPNPTGSPSALPTPSAYSTPGLLSGSYGLILSAGQLQLIKADGSVAASASVAAPSVQFCSSAHDGAMQAPPVSASGNYVYFRDGNTKIRMVVPPASATDVTTVPGGPTTISFFSVSPDDQRIAVLVEDLSGTGPIKLRLYVEDLHGHTNHSDIYTTTTPRRNGTTLWPMGWHQDTLVLAVVTACTFEPAGLAPIEWHVSNATTAVRIATIRSANCTFAFAPSPAGVGCVDPTGVTTIYNWAGKVVSATGPGSTGSNYGQAGLSPGGKSIFFVMRPGYGSPPPSTGIVQLGPGPYATVQGHNACAWIDEDHLLAPDAVIQFPAETAGNVKVIAKVTALAASGVCVGRFPGTL
jgi:hypothetical protein